LDFAVFSFKRQNFAKIGTLAYDTAIMRPAKRHVPSRSVCNKLYCFLTTEDVCEQLAQTRCLEQSPASTSQVRYINNRSSIIQLTERSEYSFLTAYQHI